MADFTAVQPGDELEPFYKGLFLRARAALGVQSFGMAVVVIEPGTDPHPDHAHEGGQEEVYVVLSGSGELVVAGETVPLAPETMVRVGADARRKITPGPDGIRLLALGGTPGQAYEAPGYTELGAPDPLG